MIYRKPHYFDDFSCLADKCVDTCCSGWQIVIDDDTLEKYGRLSGKFSDELKSGVDFDEGCYKQRDDKRCIMLMDNGLCRQICALGEESLCKTCHLYPRHVEEYEGLREWTLSLSCPEAAHIILNSEEPVRIIETEDDQADPLEDEFENFDFFMFTQLEETVPFFYKLAISRETDIESRAENILEMARLVQSCIDDNRYADMAEEISEYIVKDIACYRYEYNKMALEILDSLEVLREEWMDILKAHKILINSGKESYEKSRAEFYLNLKDKNKWNIFKENVLFTTLFTWLNGSVYDDMFYAKAALAVFCMRMIEEISITKIVNDGTDSFETFEEITRRFMREVEHSDDNLIAIEDFLSDRM